MASRNFKKIPNRKPSLPRMGFIVDLITTIGEGGKSAVYADLKRKANSAHLHDEDVTAILGQLFLSRIKTTSDQARKEILIERVFTGSGWFLGQEVGPVANPTHDS